MSHKRKPACALNQQLLNKLTEFETEVNEKHTDNLGDALSKAIRSLCKFPLPIIDIDTAKLLDGVGPFIAGKIDKYLKDIYSNGIPVHLQHLSLVHDTGSDIFSHSTQSSPTKKAKKADRIAAVVNDITKNPTQSSITTHLLYNNTDTTPTSTSTAVVKEKRKQLPKFRSGAYAILIALYLYSLHRNNEYEYLFEDQLKQLAQSHTDSSMYAQHNTAAQSHYSAFNSKKSLVDKGWIDQTGKPLRYTITAEGIVVAKQLLQQNSIVDPATNKTATTVTNKHDDISMDVFADNTDAEPVDIEADIKLAPNVKYDVILLIDKRERAMSKDKDRSYIAEQLLLNNIPCERRQITIGDIMWIAKPHNTPNVMEYVVDCIVERKKIADMWSSIKDGRYHEQRKRLQLSGIKRIMYILEGNINRLSGTSDEIRKAEIAVESAVSSLTMTHNILVQHTPDTQHTIQSLIALTKQLQTEIDTHGLSKIQQRTDNTVNNNNTDTDTLIRSATIYKPIEYRHFRAQCEKDGNMRVADLFNIQLRQIKGCSADRSIAIRKLYPTVRHLIDAYEQCSNAAEEELLLAGITAGATNAKIGDAISRRIRTFFRATSYTNVTDT